MQVSNQANPSTIEPKSERNYPRDKTLHELFETQVEKTPENIALIFHEDKLTPHASRILNAWLALRLSR